MSQIERGLDRSDVPIGRDSGHERRYTGVLTEFTRLAEHPMGGDTRMGAFYRAARRLVATNSTFGDFIDSATQRDITPTHFANLFLRGVQYVEMFEKGRTEYSDKYTTPEAWEDLLVGDQGVLTTHKEALSEILATKETTTTIYQRYAGVKAALNALFPDQEVSVADFGCGANHGLVGLKGNVPMKPVEVDYDSAGGTDTGDRAERIHRLLGVPVTLKEGFAVDKTNPASEEERKWRVACSFYPKELSRNAIDELTALEVKMDEIAKTDTDMRFLQGDLLELRTNHADGTLPAERFDAVVMSTILYQMTTEEQMIMIDTARKSLKPTGVLILQDFGTKDRDNQTGLHIQGLNSTPFSYRTFVMHRQDNEWLEFLRWSNGRCRIAQPGEDFDRVKPITQRTDTTIPTDLTPNRPVTLPQQ